jgi:hypothetical protein
MFFLSHYIFVLLIFDLSYSSLYSRRHMFLGGWLVLCDGGYLRRAEQRGQCCV